MDGRKRSIDKKEASASFFLSRSPRPRWTCGQPTAPNPVHRVHQGDLRARNLLLGKFRAQEPGVRSGNVAPIILSANSGRNIVAGTAPTASLAIATYRLLKAWRQLIRLFSSLRCSAVGKHVHQARFCAGKNRPKSFRSGNAPGSIGDRR